MSEHFDVLIPLGAFVVLVLGLFLTYTGKFLSIREHTEYKLSVQRELDKMHERLNVLERTRPTTETLEAKLGATKMPRIIIITFCSMYLSTVVAAQEQQEQQQQHLPLWAAQAGIRGPTSNGFPLVDPSENVKALSEASSKRQDDLRAAFEHSITQQLNNIDTINELRFTLNRELREAAVARLDSELKLRAEYTQQLVTAEAKRIDAIRAVDVNAVAVASQRASDQATVLATQVAQSAEALRGLVATTANTVAASQQQLANTLSARITTLEQASYQQAGAKTFQDPAFIALVGEVKALAAARESTTGIGTGRGEVVGWIVGGIGLLVAFVTMIILIMRGSPAGAPPQVLYSAPLPGPR